MWLDARLALVARGETLLEQKARAMESEARRLRAIERRSRAAAEDALAALEMWTGRALVMAGDESLRRAPVAPAEVEVRMMSSFGVVYAGEVRVSARPAVTAGEGSAALDLAAAAAPHCVEAALEHAAARQALERLEAELMATTRRLRALERRWTPALEGARRELSLQLEESERDEAVRVRWAKGHAEGRSR
jgi:V/A-type H+/Na+-transporting ATPase subunit D